MGRKKKQKGLKIKNETVVSQFKEIKKEKSPSVEDIDFGEADSSESSNGTSFSPTGNRAAPILQSDSNLEQVAQTAPASRTANADAAQAPVENPYTTSYSTNYSNADYSPRQSSEPQRVTLPEQRMEFQPVRSSWTPSPPVQETPGYPERLVDTSLERSYEPQGSHKKLPFERRRRVGE